MPCELVTVSPGFPADNFSIIDCWTRLSEIDGSFGGTNFWVEVANNSSTTREVGVLWRLSGVDVLSAAETIDAGDTASFWAEGGYDYLLSAVGAGDHTIEAEIVQLDGEPAQGTSPIGCGTLTITDGSTSDPCDGVDCPSGEVCVDGDCVPENPDNEPPEPFIDSVDTNNGVMSVSAGGSDPDGEIVAWDWELVRDGSVMVDTATGQSAQLTLGQGGDYDLTVIATDDQGATGTDTFSFAYTPSPDDPCADVNCGPCETCQDGDCVPVDCPSGEECVDGSCVPVDPCDGVNCGECEICIDGSCEPVADPCCGVSCPPGEECCGPNRSCEAGTCVSLCANVDCGPCETCEGGDCVPVDNPCCGVSCGDGEVCEGGDCVPVDPGDPCADVTCGDCETCVDGDCVPVDNPCCGVSCPDGEVCDGGQCVPAGDGPGKGEALVALAAIAALAYLISN